ncbi:hypothetical protein HBI81_209120 [Parastagonospora nodorum]|nr:hypothetical protein HBH46_057610 [Parastagonospora nodorum]KAH5091299.1 hypothetical protein HBH72_205290 [Parastagonospora nodorum]KAH5117600.1 hypothetical protein HBH71_098900 [Parastagonospora nodorum]KAH5498318.1 hypothetical protein HBI29_169130 [Parastagonospora nodorum]KAH5603495.1 hypothetical protein HBI45_116520 [Parastagonospora nodorum]
MSNVSLPADTRYIRSAYSKTHVHAYKDSQQPQSTLNPADAEPTYTYPSIGAHSRPHQANISLPTRHQQPPTYSTFHSIPGSAILLDRPTAASNKSHTTNSAPDHRCRSKHNSSSTWTPAEKLVWPFNSAAIGEVRAVSSARVGTEKMGRSGE